MKYRLEINSKGGWQVLDRFDEYNLRHEASSVEAAVIVADTINAIAGREAATLRICTNEKSARAIHYYEQGKWQPCN